MKTYSNPVFPYVRPAGFAGPAQHWPVIVVGAGPVGLAAAIDLAQRGIDVLLLDEDNTVSVGSRAICWSKRSLEILDRLGCADQMVGKGVGWNTGRVFFRDEQVFEFNLLPETGHRRPAFINLQQYHVEGLLVERASALPQAELRWRSKVVGVTLRNDRAMLRVSTPDGEYDVQADWLIVADGSKSPIRTMLGLESEGQVFNDRFLITDIHMTSAFPAERWFWFDPPFHCNQSALLHRQADDVWRVDLQLGPDADPDEEKKPERILPRLQAMLGKEARFEIEWASVYTFQCRRMQSFREGRALFAGDAAHLVSPFGARGANSGIQDADNLAWKLELVLSGLAPESLLDSYDQERGRAADENIRHSTRSTDFITPKSRVSRIFRDAALQLAKRHSFARRIVNSGRLSLPTILADSALNTADTDDFAGAMIPGAPAADAPVSLPGTGDSGWFLELLHDGFTLVLFAGETITDATLRALESLAHDPVGCRAILVRANTGSESMLREWARELECIAASDGLLTARYDAKPGTAYLFRPDQHVCARWRSFDAAQVRAAIGRASAQRQKGAAREAA